VISSDVYHPNPVIADLRARATALLDHFGIEAWLDWAGLHDLMPNTRGSFERRVKIGRRLDEDEKRRKAERARLAALARKAQVAKAPIAGPSRLGAKATARVDDDDDVEMLSDEGTKAKAKANAKAKSKGKGKAKAKDDKEVIPPDAVEVSHAKCFDMSSLMFLLVQGGKQVRQVHRAGQAVLVATGAL
jgi:hypothetical protein